MSATNSYLLLIDPSIGNGERLGLCLALKSARASLLASRRGGQFRLVLPQRLNSEALRASAEHGGRLAYGLLQRERMLGLVNDPSDTARDANDDDPEHALWAGLQMAFEMPSLERDVDGRSAELLFALSTLRAALVLPGTPLAFAATGMLNGSGIVQSVDGVTAKIRAALGTLPRGAVVLYPQDNHIDVGADLEREAAAVGIKLHPARSLEDAARTVGLPISGGLEEPWRGLEPYEAEHRAIFVGRRREEEAMHRLLLLREASGHPGALVLAASGAGKTSFLQAGALPELQYKLQDGRALQWWRWRPGSTLGTGEAALAASVAGSWNPGLPLSGELPVSFDELGAALRQQDWEELRLVWVVDPFEETFTSGFNPEAIRALCRFMREVQQLGVWILGGMPSRYMESLQAQPELLEIFGSDGESRPNGLFYLNPLKTSALREVIERPAQLAGLRLEQRDDERLEGLMLDDLAGQADALALLSVALMRLHEKARDAGRGELRITDYREMGGLKGAIQSHAAEAMLSPSLSDAARQQLPRLVRALTGVSGPDRELVPRNVALNQDWVPGSPGRQLIDWLVKRRLLAQEDGDPRRGTPDQVRVVHRVLLTHWVEQLEQASTDSIGLRELLALRDRLEVSANTWNKKEGRADRALLSSEKDLADARVLQDQLAQDLQSQDLFVLSQFIEASLRQADEATAADRRRSRQIRIGAVASASLAILFLAAGVGLFVKSKESDGRLLVSTRLRAQLNEKLEESTVLGTRLADQLRVSTGLRNDLSDKLQDSIVLSKKLTEQLRVSTMLRRELDERLRQSTIKGLEARSRLMWDGSIYGTEMDAMRMALAAYRASGSSEALAVLQLSIYGSEAWQFERVVQTPEEVNCIAIAPDGNRIVSGGKSGDLRLWDATTGRAIGTPLKGHTNSVQSVAFSPDGKRIVSASFDHTLRLWDAASGRAIGEPLKGHRQAVVSVAFSPDGKRIVSGGKYDKLRLWDAASGRPVGESSEGPYADILSVAFSPDGQRIVSTGNDKVLRFWDAISGQPLGERLKTRSHRGAAVAFSPDGKLIVSADRYSLQIWDAVSGQPVGDPLEGHTGDIKSVSFSPDSKRIVSGGADNTLRLRDVGSRKVIGEPLKGHTELVSTLAFSRDGKRIVSGSHDNTLRLWNAVPVPDQALGEPLDKSWRDRQLWTVSPDGKRIVKMGNSGSLQIWDAISGQPIGEPLMKNGEILQSVAFNSDGTHLVSGSVYGTLQLWDAASGRPVGEPWKGHTKSVHSVAFSPDGKSIVSGSDDYTLRLWDAISGHPLSKPMQGHKNSVRSVAFSPNGKLLVSGSVDKTLRLWDTKSGQSIGGPLNGHTIPVLNVTFTLDGQSILSEDNRSTLRRWEIPDAWPALVCSKLSSNWSPKDWLKFVGDGLPYVEQCPGLPIAKDDK